MQRFRFDDKQILINTLVEMLNHGYAVEELDIVLSRVGPVDLDLMHQCLNEIIAYNNQLQPTEPIAIAA